MIDPKELAKLVHDKSTSPPKFASRSVGPDIECKMPWPEDCKVQCGRRGIVGTKDGKTYYTAFFEAFPGTFIRGEGEIIEEAERACWEKFQTYNACHLDHTDPENFERRSYKNGAGFCKECGYFGSKMFEPSEECCQCGAKTFHTQDTQNRWWCEDCSDGVPEEFLTSLQKSMREEPLKTILREAREKCGRDAEESIKSIIAGRRESGTAID